MLNTLIDKFNFGLKKYIKRFKIKQNDNSIKFYKYNYTFKDSYLIVETCILFKKTYKNINFPTQKVFDSMKN